MCPPRVGGITGPRGRPPTRAGRQYLAAQGGVHQARHAAAGRAPLVMAGVGGRRRPQAQRGRKRARGQQQPPGPAGHGRSRGRSAGPPGPTLLPSGWGWGAESEPGSEALPAGPQCQAIPGGPSRGPEVGAAAGTPRARRNSGDAGASSRWAWSDDRSRPRSRRLRPRRPHPSPAVALTHRGPGRAGLPASQEGPRAGGAWGAPAAASSRL